MRRKHLALFVSVPIVNALSLGNFQGISSDSLPLSCQLAYAATIPSCTVADFGDAGCTPACVSGLQSIATSVQSACDGVEVSSKTLLGTILNGGMIQALCPILAAVTQPPPSPPPPATELPANSVTIPTDSRGVTGGLGLRTSTTTQQAHTTKQHTTQQAPKPTTVISTTRTTSELQSTISDEYPLTTTSSTTQSVNGGGVVTTTTSSKESSTAKAVSTSTPKADRGSGGGSPFDISSNGGTDHLRGSLFGAVIAIVACTLLLR